MAQIWKGKDNFSRKAHQAIIDRMEEIGSFTGVDGLLVEGGPSRSIAISREEIPLIRAIAVIVAGETAEYEFDDPRYRCTLQFIKADADGLDDEDDLLEQREGASSPSEGDDEDGPALGWTVTAYNMAEVEDPDTLEGTHELREDGTYVVELFGRYDRSDPPVLRWWFSSYNIPKGQYRGMTLQVVANNAVGYDFTLAHPDLD